MSAHDPLNARPSLRTSRYRFYRWYWRHPAEAFINYRRDGRSFVANVWILTGWRWASWLLRHGVGERRSKR